MVYSNIGIRKGQTPCSKDLSSSLLHVKHRHNFELILMSRNFKNSDPKNDRLDPFLFVIHNSFFNFEDLHSHRYTVVL